MNDDKEMQPPPPRNRRKRAKHEVTRQPVRSVSASPVSENSFSCELVSTSELRELEELENRPVIPNVTMQRIVDAENPEDANKVSICWHNHSSNFVSLFNQMLKTHSFTDCVLSSSEGKHYQCHKAVLTACSDYFKNMLRYYDGESSQFIVLTNVSQEDLEAVLKYMYTGIVSVPKEKLDSFLRCADTLKVRGVGALFNRERESDMDNSNLNTEYLHSSHRRTCSLSSNNSSPSQAGSTTSYNDQVQREYSFENSQNPLSLWGAFPALPQHMQSPASSHESQNHQPPRRSYDNFCESSPLSRKKQLSSMVVNADTPILRNVLGRQQNGVAHSRQNGTAQGRQNGTLVNGQGGAMIASPRRGNQHQVRQNGVAYPHGNLEYGNGLHGNGMNGHGINGHGINGHVMNGHGMNAHGINGHGMNGHGMNSNGMNGNGMNGNGINDDPGEGTSTGTRRRRRAPTNSRKRGPRAPPKTTQVEYDEQGNPLPPEEQPDGRGRRGTKEWKRYKQYTREHILTAMEVVRKKELSALQAARRYGVPSRTLYDKLKKAGILPSRAAAKKNAEKNGNECNENSNEESAQFPYAEGVNGEVYGNVNRSMEPDEVLEIENNRHRNFLMDANDMSGSHDASYENGYRGFVGEINEGAGPSGVSRHHSNYVKMGEEEEGSSESETDYSQIVMPNGMNGIHGMNGINVQGYAMNGMHHMNGEMGIEDHHRQTAYAAAQAVQRAQVAAQLLRLPRHAERADEVPSVPSSPSPARRYLPINVPALLPTLALAAAAAAANTPRASPSPRVANGADDNHAEDLSMRNSSSNSTRANNSNDSIPPPIIVFKRERKEERAEEENDQER